MKKICLIIAMLWVNVMACMSQTYYYKYLYTVNKKTGAKSSPGDGKTGMYITFTNNKSHCYHSDKNGNVYKSNRGPYAPATDELMEVYNYEGSNNGILVSGKPRSIWDSAWQQGDREHILSQVITIG
ncbi:MAG: hypothetical protein J5931_10040 [Prevotella sp.]|nr:hypothetical protein [Prevotella sp.]